MDRILVFDKGKIAEEGTHTSLLKLDGLYAQMWKMQVGGFLPDKPIPL
jgi:ATP-binding cassette subfamily B protein